MSSLFNILQNIFDLFTSLFDFVFGLIEDLVYIATLLPKVILKLPNMLSAFLPSSIVTILVTLVGVTVIYRIMGRD